MVSVIGAGKWGQALFAALKEKNSCIISSRTRRDIQNFVGLEEALKAKYIVCTIPSQQISQWLKENYQDNGSKFLVAAKGIQTKDLKFLDQIYQEYIPKERLSFLSGPSFASEVMQKLPCAVVISSCSNETAREFADLFPSFMRTYTSNDVVGAEICGAYKNVIAIASGICDGLNLGNNARASLIARGLVEMARFGKYFGAKDETFMGLSGAGDLFLSASSKLSRNYRVGFGLAQNKKLSEILKELGEVAEGVETSQAIIKLGEKNGIYTPIANAVLEVINGQNAAKIAKNLISKD